MVIVCFYNADRRKRMDRDVQVLKNNLTDLLSKSGSIRDLCNMLSDTIGIPVALSIPTRTIIEHSADYNEDLLKEYSDHLEFCVNSETKERIDSIENELLTGKTYERVFPYMRYKHLVCGCLYNHALIGVIDCVVTKKTDTDNIMQIVQYVAPVFTLALQLYGYADDSTKTAMQIYLKSLLSDDSSNWAQMHNIYDAPLESVKNWQFLWSPPLADAWAKKRMTMLNQLCQLYPRVWHISHDDGILVVWDADSRITLEQLSDACGKLRPVVASDPFTDLRDLPAYLSQAQMAMLLRDYEKADGQIFFVHDYKMPMMYLYLKNNSSKLTLCHPLINKIKEYDLEHGNEYYETIRAYLLCHRSYSEMAAHLNIHKNTVVYRMQKIKEIFDIDLSDCRLITALYLSLFEDFHYQK